MSPIDKFVNPNFHRKKKRYSRLSGGCAIIITTGKIKDTVVCLAGARSLLQAEKKKNSHLSVECAVLAITTGKKKIQLSVWQVVLLYCVSFWFWREIGSFFVVAGNFYYDRKKKDTVVCLLGAQFWRLRLEKKKIQSSVWPVVLVGGVCFPYSSLF